MIITGNLHGLHIQGSRPDLLVLVVSAGMFGGTFNCRTADVTLDGKTPHRVGEVADFFATREFTAVTLNFDAVDVGGIGTRKATSVKLVTVEEPVSDFGGGL